MGVKISPGLRRVMLACSAEEAPREACGLLLGVGRVVLFVQPLTNRHDEPEHHYRITPEDAAVAVHRAVALGVDVLGGWHSHPRGPDRLSPSDVRNSPGTEWVHVLVSPPNRVRAYVVHPPHRPVEVQIA